ncbi:MAG: hypothetical protein O2968_20430 [Acidobacteria bacterium]|nr:hypothetical protein [Acidobacteriota bacterium]
MNQTSRQFGFLDQLQRCSLALPPAPASVWVHGETQSQFEAAGDVISGLVAGEPQVRLVLTSAFPETVAFLRHWLPGEQTGALPWGFVTRRYISKVNPRLIVLLDGGRSFGREALAEARRSGVQVALLSEPSLNGGLAPAVPGDLVFPALGQAPERVLETLRPFVPSGTPIPMADAWLKGTWRDKIGQSRLWRGASRLLAGRRIDDWEALRERLGRPRAVLCLGNGPSSEDPRLAGLSHDCLMRVNWRWRDRGLLTRPQLVFVGDAATIHRVPACIFGFWNKPIESAMLLRHLVTQGPRRMEYVTLERVSPLIRDRTWPARPSNGALMIVAAAGLAPERLIIGGIDLFQHADGRYPGDALSTNAYTRVHHRDTDLALIDTALRDYQGDLVILSDILRESLARRRRETISDRPE